MNDQSFYQQTQQTQSGGTYQAQPNYQPVNTRKWAFIVVCVLVALLLGWLFFWLARTSYIIVPSSAKDGEITVTNQNGNSFTTATKGPNAKIRVPVGVYGVVVRSNNRAFINRVQTKGFLRSTEVDGDLVPQKARQFVGDNPASCSNYYDGVLISYSCHDLFGGIKVHRPATSTQPTFIEPVNNFSIDGAVESIISTNRGRLALIKSNDSGKHKLYLLNSNGSILQSIEPKDITDQNQSYALEASGEGFIIYDSLFTSAAYYQSLEATPKKLPIGAAVKDLSPISISADANSSAVLYSSAVDAKKPKSKVVISGQTANAEFEFDYALSAVRLCGKNGQKLCLVGQNTLFVYSIDGKNSKLNYSLPGISSMLQVNDDLLVVNSHDIFRLDLDKGTGPAIFSSINGLSNVQASGQQLLTTVALRDGKQAALLITPNGPESDDIDRKLIKLQSLPEVSAVSAYGNFIFVVPNVGDPVWVEADLSFGFDPVKVKSTSVAINKRIAELQIDTSRYKIINTAL